MDTPSLPPAENDSVISPAPTPESAGPSRQALIIALVAVFFFAAGMIIDDLLLGGKSVDTRELTALVRSVVSEEVAKVGGDSGVQTSLINNYTDDPTIGSEDAVITIVEFSDFYCGYCGRFAVQTMPQLQAQYGDKIKFVYRDMPIIAGTLSWEAAISASCANDQGKFWEFHNLLFGYQAELNSIANPADATAVARQSNTDATTRLAFAGEIGMDTVAYETCLNDPDKDDEVTRDWLDGLSLGVTGTPAFYINGRFLGGAQPYDIFAQLIDNELEKLGIE